MSLIQVYKKKRKCIGRTYAHIDFWLILAILLIFPLGQLTRIDLPFPEVRLYWHDFLIIGLVSCLVIRRPAMPGVAKIFKLILGFASFGLFSLLLNSYKFSLSQVSISSFYLWRWLAYSTIYFVVFQFGRQAKNKVLEFMVFGGVAAAIFGLLQYFFLPDARDLMAAGWDPHLFRVIGTFLDPGFTGLIYVFTLILLIDRMWRQKNKKAICYLLFAICYSALALSYARSAYLAFLAGMWAFAYFKKSIKFGIAMTLFFLVTLPLLPRPAGEGVKLERQNSIWARLDSWEKAIVISKENPVFGVGFNTYRYIQAQKGFLGDKWQKTHAGAGADSSLLSVLATTGAVGLVVFTSLYFQVFKIGVRNFDCKLLPTLIAVFIHSLFNNSLFYPWVMIWLWLLLGLSTTRHSKGA